MNVKSALQHQKQPNRIHIAMNDDEGIAHLNENVRGIFTKGINGFFSLSF